jgi:hypothetical protein|tara:strand:- start:219 stop:461 length:243 start_codon:yes stop_codon:yes gene_type:complete
LKRKQDYQFHKEDLKKTHYFVPSNQFLIIEIEEDPLIGQTTQALFLKYEPMWEGVDQIKSNFLMDPQLYFQLKEFLFHHF